MSCDAIRRDVITAWTTETDKNNSNNNLINNLINDDFLNDLNKNHDDCLRDEEAGFSQEVPLHLQGLKEYELEFLAFWKKRASNWKETRKTKASPSRIL